VIKARTEGAKVLSRPQEQPGVISLKKAGSVDHRGRKLLVTKAGTTGEGGERQGERVCSQGIREAGLINSVKPNYIFRRWRGGVWEGGMSVWGGTLP